MNIKVCGPLRTGQITCHDTMGREIPCHGSGQDAEFRRGLDWTTPRFRTLGDTIMDRLSGLIWTHDANLAEFPLSWAEALSYIDGMNQNRTFGSSDWRMPNRRELRSLISHQTRKPALPEGHPFVDVFQGWYWTSTTASIYPGYAWYIHMEGGRMFYGNKKQLCMLWPVRGEGYKVLPVTGQTQCYDVNGRLVPCKGSGQDAEFRFGRIWPENRFEVEGEAVIDHLTNLCWRQTADVAGRNVTWSDALISAAQLNKGTKEEMLWRLPNINELESLVDCSMHSPALPAGHPFSDVREGYWSSTTSMFEPDWAWALYLNKGAIGVGQKKGEHFSVWAVCDATSFDRVSVK